MSDIQTFLTQVVEHYPEQRSLWHMLAKHGHPGVVAAFTDDEQRVLDGLKKEIGGECPLGYCYMNAQKLALAGIRDKRVQYVEGLVASARLPPLEHAWIEFNGKVYDPTLTDNHPTDRIHEYHGVLVPKSEILKFQFKVRTYSPLSMMGNDALLAKIWKIK